MNPPPFELLQMLIAAAESRNLVEAASRLGISQPAISTNLKKLEALMPLPVFALEGKRKTLTRYGRELYLAAKEQDQALSERLERLNRSYADPRHLTLRVGCRRELFLKLADRFIFAGKLEFSNLSSQEAVRNLLDHELDVAISYSRPDSPEIMARKLLDSDARLVVHKKWLKGHRSLASAHKSAEFLQGTPCVFYESGGHLLRDWIAYRGLALSSVHAVFVSQDWQVIQALVDQGHGYAVVPNYVASSNPEVLAIDLPHAACPRFTFYSIFHRDLKRIPAFAQLPGLVG